MNLCRHDPTNPHRRVAVIRGGDCVQVGTMPAHVGMILAHGGEVVKVNERSFVVRRGGQSDARETGTFSIFVSEARKFGFPTVTP